MSCAQFIKFEPTPGEKHIGIATVNFHGKIILRYKIVPNKDGSSFFPAPGSYKMPGADGEYKPCFTVDSNSEREEIEELIKANVRNYLSHNRAPQPAAPQAPIQPNASYPYAQTAKANYYDAPPPMPMMVEQDMPF